MHDTAKYLIHGNITADGVVERSDVVGAIFGQTEGLLGDELDLRDLQDASKVGRIDVEISSRNGQSFGSVTIASSLDQVETAILAASLETIDRIGPCRSTVEVEHIEDVRAAKRREVVSRAKRLLAEAFDGSMTTSEEIIEEVRRAVRVEDITEYEGYPAGPNVAESDAIVVVEGRADVLQLLKYGLKNAVAVEGTNVPEAVAELTRERTVTAFLDGDRGGELILKELGQVGEIDYVAFAPADRSVEDLSRHETMAALREKVPYGRVENAADPGDAIAATDGSATPAPDAEALAEMNRPTEANRPASPTETERPTKPGQSGEVSPRDDAATVAEEADNGGGADDSGGTDAAAADTSATADETVGEHDAGEAGEESEETAAENVSENTSVNAAENAAEGAPEETSEDTPEVADDEPAEPETLRGHVRQVVVDGSDSVRLLDADYATLAEETADEAFTLLKDVEEVPAAVVIDGELSQRALDVTAQRGVGQVVARSVGEFVKRPSSVRIRTAEQLLGRPE